MSDIRIYSQTFHLDCFLLNHLGEATLVTYFNLMQEIALRHSKILGFGKQDMELRKMYWVLTRMGLEITKTLKWDSEVTVTTWSKGLNGPFSFRDFTFHDNLGNQIGRASSSWVPLDIETRKPANISNLSYINEKSITNKSTDLELDKIFIVNELVDAYHHVVRNTDLDINAHANNARYVEWIYNSLPLDFFKAHPHFNFQINYLGEAKLSEQINIARSKIELSPNEIYFDGKQNQTNKKYFNSKLNLITS